MKRDDQSNVKPISDGGRIAGMLVRVFRSIEEMASPSQRRFAAREDKK